MGTGAITGYIDVAQIAPEEVLLGDLLARVVAGREPETLLDHYG